MIHQYCQLNLQQIQSLLRQIETKVYVHKSSLLSNSSIGQHTRHILEFYICLLNGVDSKKINYDTRERCLELETNLNFAIQTIQSISEKIESYPKNISLLIEGSYSSDMVKNICIETSLHRELAHCLEHSIHHQALIKISLAEQHQLHRIDATFGIAPATIRHKQQLA